MSSVQVLLFLEMLPVTTVPARQPQKRSGSIDVGFFSVGTVEDRQLIFYQRNIGLVSTFKVLESVLQKENSRSRFLPSTARRRHSPFFRECDEFYIQAESYRNNPLSIKYGGIDGQGYRSLDFEEKTVPRAYRICRVTSLTRKHY